MIRSMIMFVIKLGRLSDRWRPGHGETESSANSPRVLTGEVRERQTEVRLYSPLL